MPTIQQIHINGGKDNPSFAIVDGERRPIIVWMIVKCKATLVNFSYSPRGARFTAQLSPTLVVIGGTYHSAAEFEKARQKASLSETDDHSYLPEVAINALQ